MCTKTTCALKISGPYAEPEGYSLRFMCLKCCCATFLIVAPSSVCCGAFPHCIRASIGPSLGSFLSELTRWRSSLFRSPAPATAFAWSPVKPYWCQWGSFQSQQQPSPGVSGGSCQKEFLRRGSSQCWLGQSNVELSETTALCCLPLCRFRCPPYEVIYFSGGDRAPVKVACQTGWCTQSCLVSHIGTASS